MNTDSIASKTAFDVTRRYIRIIKERPTGLVELEFAVGEPEIFVEMILPQEQFREFCREQGVEPSHGPLPDSAISTPEQEWEWTLRHARDQHFGREEAG